MTATLHPNPGAAGSHRWRLVLAALAGWLLAGGDAAAATGGASSAGPGSGLIRLAYDNDLFIARDDASYSGGLAVQSHSPPLAAWDRRADGRPRRGLARWVGERVPGLGAGDGRVLRFSTGLTHTTQTPDDLRTSRLQPADVPYAGTLGAHWSWAAFDDRSLAAFQLYAGVLGPLAGAEELHQLLHDGLGRGPEPRGWDVQLDDEPLLNLGYAVKRKLAAPPAVSRGPEADLAVGFHQALGTLYTATELQLEFRAGPRLARGFAQVPDAAGQGIALEPIFEELEASGAGRRLYASLVVRATALWHSALLDGGALADSAHPGIGYDTFFLTAVLGLHLDLGRFAGHVSYFGSGLDVDTALASRTSPSWLSFTLDYRW